MRRFVVKAVRARFDGKTIQVPKELRKAPAGDVLVIIPDSAVRENDKTAWTRAQESAFSKVWDNDEDAVYDS